MKKHRIIRKIEKEEKVYFSETKAVKPISSVDKIENSKSLSVIHGCAEYDNRHLLFVNKLYKTPSGFYIYWEKTEDNSYYVTIYHKYEHTSEVLIYLAQLNK